MINLQTKKGAICITDSRPPVYKPSILLLKQLRRIGHSWEFLRALTEHSSLTAWRERERHGSGTEKVGGRCRRERGLVQVA